MSFILSIVLTLIIIFAIPVLVYGLFSSLLGLKEPAKKFNFMMSVLVQKVGTSIGFVWLFYLAKNYFGTHWLLYAIVWIAMFAIVEIGQAIGPDYSKKEAAAGIISEFIYFPLAAAVISKVLT